MGQGTESCGGYDVDFDEYEEGLATGTWTQRDGSTIKVSDMSLSHLYNAKRIARAKAESASFTDDADKWRDWVDLFTQAIDDRALGATRSEPAKKAPQPIKPKRGTLVDMICHCGTHYQARQADLKRGYGLSCGKRCAAIRREFGKPPAKRK